MEEEFSLRQKWFPTPDEAEEIAEERGWETFGNIGGVALHFFGRWARSIALGGLLAFGTYQGVGNNIEYSNGQRVGVINKISEKGVFWKTKEGQLSLEGRSSTGDYIGAGVWDFSIDRSNEEGSKLQSQLKEYMEKGARVKITYKQPFATWPWRADTTYLIQSVEPLLLKKNN